MASHMLDHITGTLEATFAHDARVILHIDMDASMARQVAGRGKCAGARFTNVRPNFQMDAHVHVQMEFPGKSILANITNEIFAAGVRDPMPSQRAITGECKSALFAHFTRLLFGQHTQFRWHHVYPFRWAFSFLLFCFALPFNHFVCYCRSNTVRSKHIFLVIESERHIAIKVVAVDQRCAHFNAVASLQFLLLIVRLEYLVQRSIRLLAFPFEGVEMNQMLAASVA